MPYEERVPCEDGESITNFRWEAQEAENGVVEIKLFDNFKLASVRWRQEFTDSLTAHGGDLFPGQPVIFCVS